MNAAALVTEATRYLEASDLLRSLGQDITWRREADELRARPPEPKCNRCISPIVRINGRHVCFDVY